VQRTPPRYADGGPTKQSKGRPTMSKIVKVEMLVALPDHGVGGLCARDYWPDLSDHGWREVTILDWGETDMKVVADDG